MSIDHHSVTVVTYGFKYCGGRPRYKADQFVHLTLDDYEVSGHWPESRVFTIANGTTKQGQSSCCRFVA